jgi:hypothetical protein
MESSENPYASPTADLTAPASNDPALTEAEMIRRKYISHEASLQSIGFIFWLGCFAMVIGTLRLIGAVSSFRGGFRVEFAIGLLYPVFAVVFGWLGRGFRKLNPRVRIPGGIFCGLGLFALPLGTLINAYFLYLIFSPKSTVVFSPEYKEIIRQTPHVKCRTSLAMWIVLILLLSFIAIGIGALYVVG